MMTDTYQPSPYNKSDSDKNETFYITSTDNIFNAPIFPYIIGPLLTGVIFIIINIGLLCYIYYLRRMLRNNKPVQAEGQIEMQEYDYVDLGRGGTSRTNELDNRPQSENEPEYDYLKIDDIVPNFKR
jgi:hypothetical protein